MAASIPPAVLPRVGQLLRMLGSDQDHEALGAVRALRRTLSGAGLSLHELAAAIERPAEVVIHREHEAPRKRREARPGDVMLDASQRARVVAALRRALIGTRMSAWERTFADSIVERLQAGRGRLTERQGETLARLLDKLGEGQAWA